MFDTELNYFIEHQTELVEKYNGKTLVIQEKKILGVFDDPVTAYREMKKNGWLGKAALQRCIPGTDAYTMSIATLA